MIHSDFDSYEEWKKYQIEMALREHYEKELEKLNKMIEENARISNSANSPDKG